MEGFGEPVKFERGPRLIVVRHGHTALNSGNETSVDRIRGWTDVPLAPEGIRDAKLVAKYLSRAGVQAVICSNLKRSIQTATEIAKPAEVRVTPLQAFRPWNLGEFQGQPSKDSVPHLKEYAEKKPDEPVPGGESFNEFKHRALEGLKRLLATVKKREITCVLITHFRDVKLYEGWLAAGEKDEEIDWGVYFRNDINPCAVIELKPDGDKWKGVVLSNGLAN